MKGKKLIKGLLFIAGMALTLAACGGGGGGTVADGGATGAIAGTATIQGQVSGTVVIAVDDDTNLEAARAAATGTPKTFSMTLPTGENYRFYLMENEGPGDAGRIYPVYMGSTNVFQLTNAANSQTINLGMVTLDFTKGSAAPANNPMGFPGVIAGGENPSIPPSLSGAVFSMGDLQGTWDFNSLATSGMFGWMQGVLSVDNTGMGAMTSLVRNGMSWPSMDNVPFAMFPSGIVRMDNDNTFHAILSKDKTMMAATWTDNTGGSALMIFRKQGGAYAQSDLYGTWNFHRLTAGSDNTTSGWAFGTMTMSSPGTATITAVQTSNNNMSEVGSSFFVSMGGNGIVTSSGDNTFHGVMSQDKNMMVLTKTNASGHYDLMVLMRSDTGVSYNTTDLTGDWMQHGVVSGDPNDTNWNFGQMVMDSTGQATFNGMMGRTGAFSMQPGTFAMNSSGVISMGGMGMDGGMTNQMTAQAYSGLMNPAKNIMVATYTDGNGGYQLGIGMK
ncbi:MAG: hypothetical protein HY896_11285 [Deltaproteobacteria bacterium]|nr:hypothetical protein [Deltaproteobacteria bacterium]